MKNEMIHMMTESFEGHAQQTEQGTEYWLARDLQHLLGYTEWRNFLKIVSKAKTACEVSSHLMTDHFVDVNKMVELGSGSQRKINDIMHRLHRVILHAIYRHYFATQCHSRERGNP